MGEKQQLGEVIPFRLRPERVAELEAELLAHEIRIDEIMVVLGFTALNEPLPFWPDAS